MVGTVSRPRVWGALQFRTILVAPFAAFSSEDLIIVLFADNVADASASEEPVPATSNPSIQPFRLRCSQKLGH